MTFTIIFFCKAVWSIVSGLKQVNFSKNVSDTNKPDFARILLIIGWLSYTIWPPACWQMALASANDSGFSWNKNLGVRPAMVKVWKLTSGYYLITKSNWWWFRIMRVFFDLFIKLSLSIVNSLQLKVHNCGLFGWFSTYSKTLPERSRW